MSSKLCAANMINQSHWHYFLALEQELIKLSQFIALDERNFGTFSIELLKTYLSICAEVDVVARLLCKKVNLDFYLEKTKNEKKQKNIKTYREIIYSLFPDISEATIAIHHGKLFSIPWRSLKEDKSPKWWEQYNEVKHIRDEFFHHANLKNIIDSISGLLVLLIYYCHPMDNDIACICLDEATKPKLLEIIGNHYVSGVSFEGPRIYIPNQSILAK